MAVAHIQSTPSVNSGGFSTSNPLTLSTANLGSSVTSGNLLVVAFWTTGGGSPYTINSVTDTLGTAYTQRSTHNFGTDTVWIYAGIAASGGTNAASISIANAGASNTEIGAKLSEYSGVGTFDTSSGGDVNNVSDMTGGTMTTAGAGVIIAAGFAQHNLATDTFTAGASFTIEAGTGNGMGVEYFITSSAQVSFTSHMTCSAATFGSMAAIAFLAAGAGFIPHTSVSQSGPILAQ